MTKPFAVIARMPTGCDGGAAGGKGLEGWLWMGRIRWANTGVVKALLNLSLMMARGGQCFVP
ncbi:hypothetical protein K443DRAFT_210829 [Laccaria amethystina LaAM-08-1]|uniref:Unplaced genomic scaffold K443scaffold_135, whole genome shotgun sequence n=1 Tax=Laccaria amethystina LaAM-08-1 TaxID=1095629 RepID=A0A0C9WZV5_9AGAR|nr:hypothetical protein K443DRAFT_210829 [Laccaria amethystina LaAM-08-1]